MIFRQRAGVACERKYKLTGERVPPRSAIPCEVHSARVRTATTVGRTPPRSNASRRARWRHDLATRSRRHRASFRALHVPGRRS